MTFDDVPEVAWHYDAVTFCAAREITTGTGSGMFSPDATLTRGQFIALLMRAYGIEADEDPTNNFDDADEISDYAQSAMETFVASGIFYRHSLFKPGSISSLTASGL